MDKEELKKLLKENLTINFELRSFPFSGSKRYVVTVFFDDEEICSVEEDS